MVPIFLCNPLATLFLVSAFRPLPQAFVYLIINRAEHLGRNNISLIIHPSTDNRVELANQDFLLCGFVALDDVPHFAQKGFHRSFRGLDKQFPVIFTDIFAKEVKSHIDNVMPDSFDI